MGGRVFAVVESPAEENGGGGVCTEIAWCVAGDSTDGGYFLSGLLVKRRISRAYVYTMVNSFLEKHSNYPQNLKLKILANSDHLRRLHSEEENKDRLK